MTDPGKPWPILCYHIDRAREILWIIHRKCAGTSLREALTVRRMVGRREASDYKKWYTITVVRHPWERLVAAYENVYNAPGSFEEWVESEILPYRFEPQMIDWHMWPYRLAIDGFSLGNVIFMENLDEEWKELQKKYELMPLRRINASGKRHEWKGLYDWPKLLDIYHWDFRLSPFWEEE